MRHKNRARVRRLLRALNPDDYERFEKIRINDLGFGYDIFGLEIESAMAVFTVLHNGLMRQVVLDFLRDYEKE